MTIAIHAFPPSPRAFKVLAAAAHVGLDYEFRLVDFAVGAQRTEAFAALNPNRKMPVLEHGELKLWESNAILCYLAAIRPDAHFLPEAEPARADAMRWLFWDSTTWDPACATLIFERVVKALFGLGDPDSAEVEKGEAAWRAAASVLAAHLAERDFVTGARPAAPDFALAAPLTLAAPAGMPLAEFPALERWAQRMAALPAWGDALALQTPPAA